MKHVAIERGRPDVWLLMTAGLGVAWNAFGITQLFDFVAQTHDSLMMKGMSAPAADLYFGLPLWMKVVFAVGSIGGLVGSVLLGLRRSAAMMVLAASLTGYVALFAGDYAYGVFGVIEGQMAILILVLAIAVGLLGVSMVARRRGRLP